MPRRAGVGYPTDAVPTRPLAPHPSLGFDGIMLPGTPGAGATDVDRRMALAREWDDLVEQVRALPGFEDFLRPPRLETLLPAAKHGPVVILNVSRWRCDALVVRPDGVEAIELPNLTQEDVNREVNRYLAAVGRIQDEETAGADGTGGSEADGPDTEHPVQDELRHCLRWMWDSFAGPVLDRIGLPETDPATGRPPRLWWCPTGTLTLLPIHAAGRHDEPGKAVLDRVVSSYTPTLRALLEARGDGTAAGSGPDPDVPARMLFVGVKDAPDQQPLPAVDREKALLESLLPAERITVRYGEAATRDTVLRDLGGHRWLHLSCHGDQDLTDPSRGRVYVHGGELTVTDFSSQQYRGEFAYLSGCKTAVGGVNLPDEAITLAAALHYTGYRHVIATLWTLNDAQAVRVARSVYRAMIRDGVLNADSAAYALHDAVLELRHRTRDTPSSWTPYAHTGP